MVRPWRTAMSSPVISRPEPIAATIADVSRRTGLSRSKIYRRLARGKLKAVKSGRSTLVLIDRGGRLGLNSVSVPIDGFPADPFQRRRNSSHLRHGEAREIHLIRGPSVKARMRPLAVVEPPIPTDRAARLGDTVVGAQVDLLILDRTPQPFDEHIVAPGPAPIHADPDRVLRQQSGERRTGELAPLVGVEDLRSTITGQRLVDRVEAEIDPWSASRPKRDRHPPGQHPSAEPVHHRSQVHEAMGHRYISDIHRPDPGLRRGRLWLTRSIAMPRSRYGNTLCPSAGLDVCGRRYTASIAIRRIIVVT